MTCFSTRAVALLLLFSVAGCGALSGPPVRLYVLGEIAPPVAALVDESGRPVFVLKTVQVPDYLDNQDMLTRALDNEVVASRSGRWAERLSIGMTRTLITALSERAPGYVLLAATPAFGAVPRQITVDIDAFDARADGQIFLAARWSIGSAGGDVAAGGRVGLVGSARALGDANLAAATTAILYRLADAIAVTLPPG
ncbi:MAG: membrane integrity-associated transporter subunit PqiC [Alphaproteobacteria bacterium]|nr:MAG: membrane integrity-associated transporter subunit PqiC [Alphaproteobacteria bacterium]